MDFLPDVLDHIGRTPREFGAVHAHLESVVADGDRVIATVLFQAAFHPMPQGGELLFFASNEAHFEIRELSREPLPKLENGAVVRVRFPLRAPFDVLLTHVQMKINAPDPAAKAKRVRQPWKLFDTVESPKLSDLAPATTDADFGIDVGRSLLGTVLSGGVRVSVFFPAPSLGGEGAGGGSIARHEAMKLPDGLVLPVQQGQVVELAGPQVELIWELGRPLPDAMPLTIAKPATGPATGRRLCAACGFSGKMADYERDRTCPNCDDYW